MRKKSIELILGTVMMCLSYSVGLAADEAEEKVKPAYVSLGDPMVLNLSTQTKHLTFLQVKADVLVKDENAKEVIEMHIPAIRHKLIVILSEKNAADMKSPTKREEVRQQATTEIRNMIEEMSNNKDIKEVLFSSFLVQ